MGKPTIRLTIFWQIGEGIQMYFMFNHSGQQIVIVTTIWWWRKLGERLAVNKKRSHRFDMERFNLKKLNDVGGKEQFCVQVSNRFAALEDLDAEVEINSAWETIRENIKVSTKESLGYFELKKHKQWFDKGCSKLLDQRRQAKLQWLQDPSERNGDNLNNVRREVSRHFRNKKRKYLKDKINKLTKYSRSKNIRDLYRGVN
jgi:hypothetical protein